MSHDIIVKQHGSSIEVDTQPGEFSEVRIVLPRVGASLSGPKRVPPMPAFVQVFGRRDDEAIHADLRPASEKRQGTKSREVESGGAAGAMGILPRARA
jgi:hypothetical protein